MEAALLEGGISRGEIVKMLTAMAGSGSADLDGPGVSITTTFIITLLTIITSSSLSSLLSLSS
jgi:hypothetical protein